MYVYPPTSLVFPDSLVCFGSLNSLVSLPPLIPLSPLTPFSPLSSLIPLSLLALTLLSPSLDFLVSSDSFFSLVFPDSLTYVFWLP